VRSFRVATARQRLIVTGSLGVAAGVVLAWFVPWQLSVLGGWGAAAGSFVGWVWTTVGQWDANATRSFATREDNSRRSAQLVLVSASVASLVGVGFDLVKAHQLSGTGRIILTATGVVTVMLSWAVVHTVFALRYAHEYYTTPVGGIDFKDDAPPDYQDFAYVAFTVGMTFQVSDTDIQNRIIRRTILRHALLSYLFGAVILAVTINVVASLLQ
jgi:uncharacterized membrane protein